MKIHTVYQSYRKKPYVARWYEGTRQRNRFFSTEKSRAEFIARAEPEGSRKICGLLALGAFAGMRSSAVIRLSRDEIDFKTVSNGNLRCI